MIGNKYKLRRDNVIDIYNNYIEYRKNFDLEFGANEGDGIDLGILQLRIESLMKEKYTLVVAGELKAGKSTFINALLGTELLPSDVLQASSAIVEIFKSDKPYLEVKYHDSKEVKTFDNKDTLDVDEAKERLHELCRISDKFRAIPSTLIDEYIVNSETEIKLTDTIIAKWEEQSLKKLSDKKDILIEYLNMRKKEQVPINIQFGYPLFWDSEMLRIVDTPGVNAIGGLQNVSESYIEEANAIIFVRPISSIESVPFKNFVDKIIPNRSKDTLFLVLTHSGLCTRSDVARLHDEAIRIYSELISAERILVVDSLLKLIANDLNNGIPQNVIEQKAENLPKFEKMALKEGKPLVEILEAASNFDGMCKVIERFSDIAPNLQLSEILQCIKEGYAKQEEEYEAKIKRLETKRLDPQTFEGEISRIKDALEEYKKLNNEIVDELKSKSSGKHAIFEKDIAEIESSFKKQISQAEDIESVHKYFVDARNEIERVISIFSTGLTDRLKQVLKTEGGKFQTEHRITLPKVDLDAMEHIAKKQAFKKKNEYETQVESIWENWNIFKPSKWSKSSRTKRVKIGESDVYDKATHLRSFKNACEKKFLVIREELRDKSKMILDEFLPLYSKGINKSIEDRQTLLELELEKKESNEELISNIKELNRKKKLLPQEKKRAEELLGDLA